MSGLSRYALYAAVTLIIAALLVLMDYGVFSAQGLTLIYNG